jgi:glycosyltransferase involved in cell wall biosynthesis
MEVIDVRVVFVGPFAFYPKGTVPVRLLPLARVLRQWGHDVVIVLPPYDNLADSGRSFRVDGVDVHNVVVPRSFLGLGYFYVAWALVRRVLRFRPDVVHVFKPKGYSGLAGMFLKFFGLTRIPVVVDSDDWEGHGGFADFFLERGVYSRFMVEFFDLQERWLLKRADAVTVASKALELRALELRDGKEGVFYVPNGPSELPAGSGKTASEVKESLGLEGKRVVLLYTRFFEYDVGEVIEVLARVVSELADVRLLVVGRGEFGEEDDLLRLTNERGLRDYVVYVGWVKPEEVRAYVEVGDVAIYPFKDTLLNRAKCPGKVVQLMSLGKAIVADKVGQIAEYIEDGKSGILVKPGDPEEFARKVIELLKNEERRKSVGKQAMNRIWDSFDWNRLTRRVEAAYELVLQ